MTSRPSLWTLPPLLALAACGGGGESASQPPAASGPPVTTAAVQPGADMRWETSASPVLTLRLRDPRGQPVNGAAVRVFIAAPGGPHDGAPLAAPVPAAVLETAMSDADGRVELPLRLPGHTGLLLIVATDGDRQAQRALNLAELARPVEMTLDR